jgi:hypothetical protein
VPQDDLVERRLKYIQRQTELDKGAVDVQFRGRRPDGSGPPNRHGMPRLPVGQHRVAVAPAGVERVGQLDLPGRAQQPGERVVGAPHPTRQQQPPAAGEAQAALGVHVDVLAAKLPG